jgi:hypothetical protein
MVEDNKNWLLDFKNSARGTSWYLDLTGWENINLDHPDNTPRATSHYSSAYVLWEIGTKKFDVFPSVSSYISIQSFCMLCAIHKNPVVEMWLGTD